MSDNLKDLIDKAEQEERTRSELQKAIDKLTLENDTLRKKLDDVKKQSKNKLNTKPSLQQDSKEIDSLKKIISSQRDQLAEKEQHYIELENKLNDLKIELDSVNKTAQNGSEAQVLFQTKEALGNVIEDYGRLENMNLDLTKSIRNLEQNNLELTKKLQTLEDIKLQNRYTEKEYNLLKVESTKFIEENKSLKEKITKLQATSSTDVKLKEKIESLSLEINQKVKEHQLLQESINNLKNENIRLKKLESLVPNMEAEISRLKQQKDIIKEKDSILLAKTITAISSQEKNKPTQTPPKIIEPKKNTIEHKIQEPILFNESKTEVKLNKTSNKELNKPSESIDLPAPQKSVQDLIAEEISEGTNTDPIKRKWQCPKCGNIDKSKIREIPDKTRIIYGSLYAKKYKCGLCANEWS